MSNDFLLEADFRWHLNTHDNRIFFYDAFISYAHGDRSFELANRLQELGAKVWQDSSQEMDDAKWRQHIIKALVCSRYVILMADSEIDIRTRPWVQVEWITALASEHGLSKRRLIIAKWDKEASIPPKLIYHPQYYINNQIDEIAQLIRSDNLLQLNFSEQQPPPLIEPILAHWPAAELGEDNKDMASLLIKMIHRALEETKANGKNFYLVSVVENDL
jgi:hypothetical protein